MSDGILSQKEIDELLLEVSKSEFENNKRYILQEIKKMNINKKDARSSCLVLDTIKTILLLGKIINKG